MMLKKGVGLTLIDFMSTIQNLIAHHQEQMEAQRREFEDWWAVEWPKLKNMGWRQNQETACRGIAWRAFNKARGKEL